MSARITFVGHSTVLLDFDGTRLLTDPVLRMRVTILRRLAPLPDVPGLLDPDAVLVSHAHLDHLDLPSLRRVSASAPAVAPRGFRRLISRSGGRDAIEIEVGERITIGNADVLATPAEHDGRRHKITRRLPALGYVIRGGGCSAYFAGDTDLFDEMKSFAAGVDVALLPIAGWGRTVGRGHLDAERAARAAALIGPRIAVPIHWGTLVGPRVSPAEAAAPAAEFARLAAKYAPEVEVRILEPGESLAL